jgi:hypothetical protein
MAIVKKEYDELEELEKLLAESELYEFDDDTNPNYIFLFNALEKQKFDEEGELLSGYKGVGLEGSSRSGKTTSWIFLLFYICLFVEDSCTINIYRETFEEFKTTLYDDFKKWLDYFKLPNRFHTAERLKSFKIGKNVINLIGCDKVSKAHGAGCDYAFFNEMIHIPQNIFDQVEMRCRKFWVGDWNPSVTQHYIFDNILKRPDIGYLRTTFRDNKKISIQERNKILSYEPWLPGSYEVIDNEIYYKGKPITSTNQPPPHPTNIDNGTADEFNWRVYGLGLRGAMKGVIFQYVTWIDEKDFPDIEFRYGQDFGFTVDPTALVKHAEDDHNIWLWPLMYEPTENPEIIDAFFNEIGVERDKLIIADSADKYTGENKGTVEMVKSLKSKPWNIKKVTKNKGIIFWINSMKKKKIHIVKNHLYPKIKKEQEMYRMREINGISINQPIDGWDHFWAATRYAHMEFNSGGLTRQETSDDVMSQLGL